MSNLRIHNIKHNNNQHNNFYIHNSNATLSIKTLNAECCYADFLYDSSQEYHIFIVILSVVMPNVAMLSVVAPKVKVPGANPVKLI
jgi:hypothetical protein